MEQHGVCNKMKKSNFKIPTIVKQLWREAVRTSKMAYAPYSKFKVGAAFEAKGRIFTGVNVENASYGATLCAERVAVAKAVSEGFKTMKNLVVVTPSDKAMSPCGLCLQVLSEFASPELDIWMGTTKGILFHRKLKELLPSQFTKHELGSCP